VKQSLIAIRCPYSPAFSIQKSYGSNGDVHVELVAPSFGGQIAKFAVIKVVVPTPICSLLK
jgi:hypothetical protein